MKSYAYYLPATGVISFVSTQESDPHAEAGFSVFEIATPESAKGKYIANGSLQDLPPCSRPEACDWSGASWEPRLTQAERQEDAWRVVRMARDALLSATDWRVVAAVERGAIPNVLWSQYRTALRDITNQHDPSSILWPVVPSDITTRPAQVSILGATS